MDHNKSGLSWDKFELEGSRESVNELERLLYCEERLKCLERLIQRKELIYATEKT